MTSTSSAAAAADLPILLASFNRWVLRARPGDQLAYHRGLLARDRWPSTGVNGGEQRQLGRLADAALAAAKDGLVHLVQRRNGPFDFTYLAVKRPILKGLSTHGFVSDGCETEHRAAAA